GRPAISAEAVKAAAAAVENSGDVADLNSKLSEKDKEIAELKESLAKKDKEIADLDEKLKNAKNAPAAEPEFKSSFDIGNVFIEAQNTAKKITVEAQAAADKLAEEARETAEKTMNEAKEKAEATTKEAKEKSDKMIADADKKAKEMVEKAEKSVEDINIEATNKASGLDKISEEIRSTFKTDLDKLKENLKSITEAISKAEENLNKTVDEADKKIADYGKTMFDKKSLDEYIKTLPVPKLVKDNSNGKSQDKPASGGNNWAMDDLEALTKQVESANNAKKDNASSNSKNESGSGSTLGSNAEKWKSDLAALAKAAEVEGI
ncbi:MAG: hypothetical protein IKH50_09030, partial [Oscillospiraceae bacterium]|nr:hypothetical protein [Oscillospiraceae bacterium]